MLPPLPYAYQPPPPHQYPPYAPVPASLPLPARPSNPSMSMVSDPIPTNAFVAKLNMGIEPLVVRDLVNSKPSSFVLLTCHPGFAAE